MLSPALRTDGRRAHHRPPRDAGHRSPAEPGTDDQEGHRSLPPGKGRAGLAPRRHAGGRRAVLHRSRPADPAACPSAARPHRPPRRPPAGAAAPGLQEPVAEGRPGLVPLPGPIQRAHGAVAQRWHGGFASYVALLPAAEAGVVVLADTARSVDRLGVRLLATLATTAERSHR